MQYPGLTAIGYYMVCQTRRFGILGVSEISRIGFRTIAPSTISMVKKSPISKPN